MTVSSMSCSGAVADAVKDCMERSLSTFGVEMASSAMILSE
jgi:hypothetical protein